MKIIDKILSFFRKSPAKDMYPYEDIRKRLNKQFLSLTRKETIFKDKKGKTIFIGDVVSDHIYCSDENKQKDRFVVVDGVKGVPALDVVWGGYGGALLQHRYHAVEIIGNVFENPELLTNQ